MEEIKWGHFSDLHFQYKNCGFSTKLLRSSLIKTLETNKVKFNYIFITGDIYNQGKYDEETTNFIKRIAEITGCNNENIIICAGNHDVKRDLLRKTSIDTLIKLSLENNNELVIEDSFYKVVYEQYFGDFHEKCNKITGNNMKGNMHYIIKYDYINLIVLNTSIFAAQTYPGQKFKDKYEEEKEKEKNNTNLYICDENLSKLKEEIGNDNKKINIVLAHHGLECFIKSEQKKFKNFLDSIPIDIYLCGHVHKNIATTLTETDSEIKQISCGGLFYDNYNTPSFIVGTLNTENKQIELKNYEYISNNDTWDLSNSAPKPYKKGMWDFIPKRFVNKNISKINNNGIDIHNKFKDLSQNFTDIILYSGVREKNIDKPFENNFEKIKLYFSNVQLKHLKLCDKIFNEFLKNSNRSDDLRYFFDLDLITYNSPACAIWNGILKNIINIDELQTEDSRFSSIITNIIENYDLIYYNIIQISAKNNLSNDINIRLSMIKKEICNASAEYVDCADNLKLLNKYLNKTGHYIYLYGEQFLGKTTLISKLIYDLNKSSLKNEDSMVPWLPKCLVIFGKQASNRMTAIKMLVEQANLILSNSIDIDSIKDDKYYLESLFIKISSEMEKVVIVIDALDEIGVDDLEMFPKKLPDNCIVILSTKNKDINAKKKLDNLIQLNLKGFNENDIYKITGLLKRRKGVTRFVKQILYKTKGNPKLLMAIADDIKKNNNEIPENYSCVTTSLKSLFGKFKEDWKMDNITNDNLYKILELLTIFEKVDYLSIESIQSYLAYKQIRVRSEEIKDLLRKVYTQIDTDDNSKYKLKYNGFAEYLIDEYTYLDFKMIFGDVFEWLLQYDKKYDYLDKFFNAWYLFNDFSRDKTRGIIDLLISEKKSTELKNILYFMNFVVKINSNFQKELNDLFIMCCTTLINTDDDIIQIYFNYLYNTVGDEKSKQDSIKYLEKLADKRNEQAVILYSKILATGDFFIKKDINKALYYLKSIDETEESLKQLYNLYLGNSYMLNTDGDMAIKYLNKLLKYKDDETMCIYAGYMIKEKIPLKTKEDGKKVLEKLIDNGSEIAIDRMADYILQGHFEEYSKKDALQLWNELARKSKYGLFKKACYIYSYEDEKRGEKLIKKYADNGLRDAILFISQIEFIRNKILPGRIKQLKAMAKYGDVQAASLLGKIIIDEKKCKDRDKDEGIKWLELAAQNNEIEAVWTLACYYYDNGYYENAFKNFERNYLLEKDNTSIINMAYIDRKGLFKSLKEYNFKEILLEIINKDNDNFAIINYVMYCIPNLNDKNDWMSMMKIIERVDENNKDFKNVVEWWNELSLSGDGEGDLVLWLLMYTNKITSNIDNKNIIQRFKVANEYGFKIPYEVIVM